MLKVTKSRFHLVCRRCMFGKTTGGGQIDPPAFLRLKRKCRKVISLRSVPSCHRSRATFVNDRSHLLLWFILLFATRSTFDFKFFYFLFFFLSRKWPLLNFTEISNIVIISYKLRLNSILHSILDKINTVQKFQWSDWSNGVQLKYYFNTLLEKTHFEVLRNFNANTRLVALFDIRFRSLFTYLKKEGNTVKLRQ